MTTIWSECQRGLTKQKQKNVADYCIGTPKQVRLPFKSRVAEVLSQLLAKCSCFQLSTLDFVCSLPTCEETQTTKTSCESLAPDYSDFFPLVTLNTDLKFTK